MSVGERNILHDFISNKRSYYIIGCLLLHFLKTSFTVVGRVGWA